MKTVSILFLGAALAVVAATTDTNKLGAGSAALGDDAIREAYHGSYRYEKAQNYQDAIKAITPVVTAYPQGYTVNLRLGWLYYLSGNYANAKICYQTAMKAAPMSVEAKLGYTLPLLSQERYEEVEAVTRQILRLDASNYYANLRLAYALRMQKKPDQAEAVLSGVLQMFPTDVGLLTEWGLIKVARHLPAERIFNDVLTLDPENVVAKAQLKAAAPPPETKK